MAIGHAEPRPVHRVAAGGGSRRRTCGGFGPDRRRRGPEAAARAIRRRGLRLPSSPVTITSPLSMWSAILQRQAWMPAKPQQESYRGQLVRLGIPGQRDGPAQMLGTIPKLKEFGLKWATLDAGWFNTHGDWDPNPQKFPGDSLRRLVDEFHKNGIRIYGLVGSSGSRGGQAKGKAAAALPRWLRSIPTGRSWTPTASCWTRTSWCCSARRVPGGAGVLPQGDREADSRLRFRRPQD